MNDHEGERYRGDDEGAEYDYCRYDVVAHETSRRATRAVRQKSRTIFSKIGNADLSVMDAHFPLTARGRSPERARYPSGAGGSR